MGNFYITNLTNGTQSTSVCNPYKIPWSPLCPYSQAYTVKQYDKLTLYYDFGFDLTVLPDTKVHYMCKELGRDLKISPAGADLMNTSGYCNPYLAEDLPAGNYSIYAYDEKYNVGTPYIILTVTAAVKPVVTLHITSNPSGAGVTINGVSSSFTTPFDHTLLPTDSSNITFKFYQAGYDVATISGTYLTSQTVNANMVKTTLPTNWKCSGAGTGVCTSGTDVSYTFPDQNTCQTTAPCAVVTNKCTGVTCSPATQCYGVDLYNQTCDPNTGGCIKGTLNQANVTQCGGGVVSKCAGVTCSPATQCYGVDLYNQVCDSNTGSCIKGTLNQTNAASCSGGIVPPVTGTCASDEMLLFGNCQKKNTVYMIGIAVFALMMMK
jgi:hypothetical protein